MGTNDYLMLFHDRYCGHHHVTNSLIVKTIFPIIIIITVLVVIILIIITFIPISLQFPRNEHYLKDLNHANGSSKIIQTSFRCDATLTRGKWDLSQCWPNIFAFCTLSYRLVPLRVCVCARARSLFVHVPL